MLYWLEAMRVDEKSLRRDSGPLLRSKVTADGSIQFDSYLAAFPADYWNGNTHIKRVRLTIATTAPTCLEVMSVDITGRTSLVFTVDLSAGQHFISSGISLHNRRRLFFQLRSVDIPSHSSLMYATWQVESTAKSHARFSVVIPTLGAWDDIRANVESLMTSDLNAKLDQVIVIDQSVSDSPTDHRTWIANTDKVQLIRQPNLGGSGAFARGLLEVRSCSQSETVFLMDDDVSLEPELLRRGLVYHSSLGRSSLLGAHMFDRARPNQLRAVSEVVRPRTFHFDVEPRRFQNSDASGEFLRHSNWGMTDTRGDFSGWWGCLISTKVIDDIGFPLPFFLKFDDVEYSLRAATRGFRTYNLPGFAVWHDGWEDQPPNSWQCYLNARNTLIVHALYGTKVNLLPFVINNLVLDIQAIARAEYSTVAMRVQGRQQVLIDPTSFTRDGDRIRHIIAAIQSNYADVPRSPQSLGVDPRNLEICVGRPGAPLCFVNEGSSGDRDGRRPAIRKLRLYSGSAPPKRRYVTNHCLHYSSASLLSLRRHTPGKALVLMYESFRTALCHVLRWRRTKQLLGAAVQQLSGETYWRNMFT